MQKKVKFFRNETLKNTEIYIKHKSNRKIYGDPDNEPANSFRIRTETPERSRLEDRYDDLFSDIELHGRQEGELNTTIPI